MKYKKMIACCALLALSAAGFAGDESKKCKPGQSCSGKPMGSTMNGDRPLVMDYQDTCKGIVKGIKRINGPQNSVKTEITLDTEQGECVVTMEGDMINQVQSGDKVEVTGRDVHTNNGRQMMGDKLTRSGGQNLNDQTAPAPAATGSH